MVPSDRCEDPGITPGVGPSKGSALITSFPSESGHGQVAAALYELKMLEALVLFKFRRGDSERGFTKVVKPRWSLGGSAVLASIYFPSVWGRDIRKYTWAHLCSPHFFHLVRENPNLTGIIHDVGYLAKRALSNSPIGYRYLFSKEITMAPRLKGIVTVSQTTQRRLKEINPDLETTVIHNWTSEAFRVRDSKGARRLLGLPLDRKIILSVGLDIPRKNIDILPHLASALGDKYVIVRIGQTDRIFRAFPQGSIMSFPSVPNEAYPLFFNAADMLAFPSIDEGFGVPLIEAINSGTPIVASDIPIFREVLKGTGFLAPPNDLDRWAEACRNISERFPDRERSKGLYRGIGDYYRASRARGQYMEFFRRAGLG